MASNKKTQSRGNDGTKWKIDIGQPLSTTSKAGTICPHMENNDYNNVMGIMEMSM